MAFSPSQIGLLLVIFEITVLFSSAHKSPVSDSLSQRNSDADLALQEDSTNSSDASPDSLDEFNGVYFDPDLVGFYLYYDPMNKTAYDFLVYKDFNTVKSSHYDPQKPTKFLIHGFTENGTSSFPTNVKNAYLDHTGAQFNIIAVDWGKLSSPKHVYPLFYNLAQSNVPTVGKRVGEFIVLLKQNGYITEEQVHLVGFSLGAHVSSNAANYVKKTTKTKIARISGLDPAGPGYVGTGLVIKRLDKKDANFVDVIHGNAGGLGFPISLGHVDFWPNGGTFQPTCGVQMQVFADSLTGLLSGSCSHGKAPVYFAMSLDPNEIGHIVGCKCNTLIGYRTFCGRQCKTKSVMGEYVSPTTRGSYYLDIIPVVDQELLQIEAAGDDGNFNATLA